MARALLLSARWARCAAPAPAGGRSSPTPVRRRRGAGAGPWRPRIAWRRRGPPPAGPRRCGLELLGGVGDPGRGVAQLGPGAPVADIAEQVLDVGVVLVALGGELG